MTRTKAFGLILFVLLVAAIGVVLVVVGPRWYAASQPAAKPAAAGEPVPARRIRATLFYVSEDGERLVAIDRDVPYGEGVLEQAKRIVEAEIAAPPPPLASALPAATRLRGLFVTDRGEAYVDFSRELVSGHPGGSLNELLTVYSIVDALAANLPAIRGVQLLVDGREVDTLAGHVDLRRPLAKNLRWVDEAANR